MSKRLLGSVLFASTLALLLLAAAVTFMSSSTQARAVLSSPSSNIGARSLAPNGVWATIAPFPTITLSPTPGSFPLKLKRANAAAYPGNGKVYVMGGRHGTDGDDVTLQWIWEYTPSTDTWVRKNALLDGSQIGNRFTANMAVAVLTDTNGSRIYAIGGSSIDSQITGTVRVYNPVADTISNLTTTDNWPASPARIPGGYAVANNKLYIFGGFSSLGSGAVFTDTWEFNPMGAVGNKWRQLTTAPLNLGRGYIAGAALDGKIYAIGGDTWDSVNRNLIGASNVERMDPSLPSPTWTNLAPLSPGRGDAGAWAYDTGTGYEISGKVLVAGGIYPVPDNKAFLYDPTTNTWDAFAALFQARRNFGSAQLNGILYALGGYDYSGVPPLPIGSNSSQSYNANITGSTNTPTNTPTFTNTRTATNTAVPTNTSTSTPVPTDTPTNTPAAQLRGHVTIQGRPAQPNALQSVPVTLTLRLTGGGPESDYSATTDVSGNFTVTAPDPGTYNWRVKNPQTLANSGSTTLVSGDNTQEMGLLITGDANNDNCVSAPDFSMLKNTFGKSVGDPGYDARADFNGDDAVSVGDFSLQKNNFGICGAGPILR